MLTFGDGVFCIGGFGLARRGPLPGALPHTSLGGFRCPRSCLFHGLGSGNLLEVFLVNVQVNFAPATQRMRAKSHGSMLADKELLIAGALFGMLHELLRGA
jgi:hypothetical protein